MFEDLGRRSLFVSLNCHTLDSQSRFMERIVSVTTRAIANSSQKRLSPNISLRCRGAKELF